MFDSSGLLNVSSGLKFIIFDRTGPVRSLRATANDDIDLTF